MTERLAFETRRHYASNRDFYGDDLLGQARDRSLERDYGVWWHDDERKLPVYRVTFVELTNEVYAMCLGGGDVGAIEVLASGITDEQTEAALMGWADVCGQPHSMNWIRQRLAAFPVLTPDV